MSQTVLPVFKRCVEAIREGVLIKKVSEKDKEYHFQNWFEDRLEETKSNYGFIMTLLVEIAIPISEWSQYRKDMN